MGSPGVHVVVVGVVFVVGVDVARRACLSWRSVLLAIDAMAVERALVQESALSRTPRLEPRRQECFSGVTSGETARSVVQAAEDYRADCKRVRLTKTVVGHGGWRPRQLGLICCWLWLRARK